MISRIIKKTVDLSKIQKVDQLEGPLYQLENGGHTFEITCMMDGEAAAVSGTVSARFLRSDEETVYFTGTLTGNVASVTLPQSCYNANGRFGLVVFIAGNDITSAVYAVAGSVYRSTSDHIIDPTEEIPSLEDLIAKIDECEEATASAQQAASFVPTIIASTYSTSVMYAVGDYCTHEGAMLRCTAETDGEFDPADWETVKVGTEFQNVDGQIDDLKSAIDDLSDICINKTEADTVYVSGGLNASYGTTTDPTRIRIKGASMVRLKSGDMIAIGGDFEGKVYASNARDYGSDVNAEVTGGVWTSGTVIIPDLYDNKFFGLLLRSKTNPTSDISGLVSSVSQYVKIYTVVERLNETVNALSENVDSFNSEFYNFTEFAGGLNSRKAWVVSNGVASFDDATGWNAKNALDVNEGEYYRVTACQGQTSNTRTWIVTDNSYNVIEMDSDHYSYDYSKHTSFIRIPSGGTKLLLTYSINSSVASPKFTWEKAMSKVDLLEEKHESLATRVKLSDLSDADTIRYSIGSTSSYVRADTGTTGSLSGYSMTDFVDISEYAYLVYSKLNVPASTTTAGTAFYTDASVDDFISGSGVFCGTGAADPYYEEDIIPVPPTAKYARFTLRKEVTGVFYVKGIRKNILSGLKLSLLGASIEAFAGAIPDGNDAYYTGSNSGIKSVDEMWWKVLCNNTGLIPLVIDAWSGSSVAYNYATDSTHSDTRKIPMCSGLRTGRLGSNGVNPDIIIVIAGANDWTYSKSTTTPLGDWNGRTAIDRTAVTSGQSTFMESYASMIHELQNNYPNAIIVCSSLEFTCRGTSNGITKLNNMGYTEADYTNAIERVCKIMGVPFIDVYNVGFTFENYYPTYCIDSETEATHPNAAGHAVIAKRFIEELPRLVKQFVH